MRLWLRRNDVDEYDVKYGAWRLYDIIYDDLIDGGINYDRDVKGKKRKNEESNDGACPNCKYVYYGIN